MTAGLAHLCGIPLLWRMVMAGAATFGVVGVFERPCLSWWTRAGKGAAFFGVLMSIQGERDCLLTLLAGLRGSAQGGTRARPTR